MALVEALCTECKETFIPHSEEPEDLIHGEQENGFPCGGQGVVVGTWTYHEPPKTRTQVVMSTVSPNSAAVEDLAFRGLIQKYRERNETKMVILLSQLHARIQGDRKN